MAIIRERDYWQAKRDIVYYEERITKTRPYMENATKDSEMEYWQMVLEIYEKSLLKAKEIVAQREGESAKMPRDTVRPANEASLSVWVKA